MILNTMYKIEIQTQMNWYWFPPLGNGLYMTLLGSTYLWSVGVMEYWKNEIPTPIFCNFIQKPSRFSDT